MNRLDGLLEALRALFASAQSFDTRAYEECPSTGEIFDRLVPPIQGELDGALSLLTLILDHFEQVAEGENASSEGAGSVPYEVPKADPTGASSLADLAFVARSELMQQR